MKKVCLAGAFVGKGEIGCKYWASDMDLDPFCCHPSIIKDNPYGLYTRRMQQNNICNEKNDYSLHEPDLER